MFSLGIRPRDANKIVVKTANEVAGRESEHFGVGTTREFNTRLSDTR